MLKPDNIVGILSLQDTPQIEKALLHCLHRINGVCWRRCWYQTACYFSIHDYLEPVDFPITGAQALEKNGLYTP